MNAVVTPAIEEAFQCAAADVALITHWLREGDQIDEHVVEGVREWADYIVGLTESRAVPAPRPIEEIRAEARSRQVARGPEVELRFPGDPPAIEIDKGTDSVRLVFQVSLDQFWQLEAAGRERARRLNVQVVGPGRYFGQPWSDELCARWAIQHAMASTYQDTFTGADAENGGSRG